jgi:hypothetical protein
MHDGHKRVVKEFYFLLISNGGLLDLHATARDPVDRILGKLVD